MDRSFIIEVPRADRLNFEVIDGQLNFVDTQNHLIDQNFLKQFDQSIPSNQIESISTGQTLANILDLDQNVYIQNNQNQNLNPSIFHNEEVLPREDDGLEQYSSNIQNQSAIDMIDQIQNNPDQQTRLIQFHQQIVVQNQSAVNSTQNNSCTIQQQDKNDTKNVPKGFLKAFAKFTLKKDKCHKQFMNQICQKFEVSLQTYLKIMDEVRKSPKISIEDIRIFLSVGQFAKINRVIVNYFLRKRFICHIFNSKMEKHNVHLKYLSRWRQIFKDPNSFYGLK